MDYIFGIIDLGSGVVTENLKTVGDVHTDLEGYMEIVRNYPDSVITDRFRVMGKYQSDDDADGNAYDWYMISDHYRYEDRYTPAADLLTQSAEASAIAFVMLTENGVIDAATAGEHMSVFAQWAPDIAYTAGSYRQHSGKLYRCVQAHTSQAGWEPDLTPALWAVAHDPEEEWPAWSAPIGAHDAYPQQSKVSYGGKHWVSDIDNNVWQPGVYGWTEEAKEWEQQS